VIQQTSLDSFYAEVERGLGLRQKMVRDALVAGPANDRMLSQLTGLPINVVTPRRGELVELGVVEIDGVRACLVSGRKSIFWRLKE